MSSEWERAARTSDRSRLSRARPCAARVVFTLARRPASAEERVDGEAKAAGALRRRQKATRKTPRMCFSRGTATTFAAYSESVSPPFGGDALPVLRSEREGFRPERRLHRR